MIEPQTVAWLHHLHAPVLALLALGLTIGATRWLLDYREQRRGRRLMARLARRYADDH